MKKTSTYSGVAFKKYLVVLLTVFGFSFSQSAIAGGDEPYTCNGGRVTSLYFNELNGGADLPITNGSTFTVAQLGSLYNMEAGTSGTIGSIKYTITGPTPTSNIENSAPYNSPGTGSGAWTGAVGTYSVNLKTYSSSGATGSLCHDTTITFILTSNSVSLGNQVFIDKNDNGIYETANGETGYDGATVRIYADNNDDGIADGAALATQTTSGGGLYNFTGLPAGKYFVRIENVPSWMFKSNTNGGDPDNNIDNDNNGITQTTTPAVIKGGTIELTVGGEPSGNANNTYDFGIYKTNGLGDFVFLDTDADGIQDAGEVGIAGVTVQLRNTSGTLLATTTTNSNGYYYFYDPAQYGTYNYNIQFVTPAGYNPSPANQGSDDSKDSDPVGGVITNVNVPSGTWNHTFDAGFVPVNCNCPGNIVLNPSFESGISNWSSSGGSLSQGTGGVACGTYSGDLNNTSSTSKAWQNIGTNLAVGTVVNVSVYAGTHDNTFNNFVAVEFLNSSNAVLSSSVYVQVDKVLANNPVGPQLYTFTATVPSGATTTRVAFGGTGSYTKTDQWCVTTTTPVCNPDDPTAANATAFCAPAPTCAASNFLWSQTINQSNGDANTVELKATGTTSYLIPTSTYPALLTGGGAVRVDITDVVSYDGYVGRSSTGAQTNERWRLVFKKSGTTVFTSSWTTDVPDNVNQSYWRGALNGANLATGADQIFLEHWDVANPGQGPNSVTPASVCIKVEALGSIGDRVWLDADGDGIQDAGETGGITGVTVQLRNSANTVIATTTTNGTGNYLFPNLPAGNYTVVFPVSISGAVVTTQNVGSNDDIDSDPSQASGITPIITLASGQNIINVDAGYCPTTLQLGNRVFNDVNNNGIDNTEAGIPGLTVNLYKDDNNDNVADGASIATTTTNATGNYNFSNLAPGNYIVGVTPPAGYLSSSVNGGDPDNNTDLDDNGQVTAGTEIRGLAITLTGGGEPNGDINNTYDFGFYLSVGSIGDRVWNDIDGDGIQDANEVGIAGVTVVLLNAAGQPIATTTTDAFGNYKFSGLPAGNYTLRVTPPANYSLSAKTQGGDTNLDSDFDPITYTTSTVTLAAGQNRTDIDAGLKFTNPQPASVGDRVWLDNNGDGVQDAGEPGVSNVLVTLYNNAGAPVRYTYTDVNGNYLFTDVMPGTYTVGVSLPPAFVFSPNNGAVSGATNSDIIPATGRTASFTVNAGDQITYVDAGIKQQQSANGSIGDYVWNDLDKDGVQEAGEPGLAGVTVRLLNATTNAVIATTTTDAAGKYIFNDVPAGNYKVEFVTPAGYTTTTKLNSNVAASGTDSDVDPATSRTATFSLAAGQRITTVDAGYWLTTGGTGKIGDRVWLDGNQNGVQDAGEANVQGVTVTLYDAANTAIKTAVTDANGNYLFTDLSAGNYTVGFSNIPQGFTFTTQGLGTAANGSDANPATGRTGTIALAAGQTNLDVDAGIRSMMAGTASIGNRVWNDLNNNGIQDAGEPGIQGVTVELLDAAGNPIDSDPVTPGVQPTTRVTNALGEYLFTGLPAGDYRVRFSTLPAGYNASPKGAGTNRDVDSDGNAIAAGTSTTDVVSVASGEERLDIDLGLNNPTAPLGQLGDRVWFDSNNNGIQDATEQGVPGVTVSLLNASNTVIATTVTDANGNYRFVNLADATYSVKFSNLPAGFVFSPKDLGGNDNLDSDADPVTGQTGTYTIAGGNTNLTVDAGIYSTRAALGDYVWFDADSDGTQDATEKGIAGVTVTLFDAANVAVTSAITDQNGRYFFSNLNPGTYTVGFSTIPTKLAFTLKDVVAAGDAADSDVDPATGITGPVTLTAGQVNLTVDAGLKPVIPATVGDYVWLDINRDGIQDAVEPGVPGVIATLYNAANQPIGSAITDGNGAYLISNVPPGTGYYVVFSNKPDPAAPWTLQNVGGAGANNNSKADATGKTGSFNVAEGDNIRNVDAGVYKLINIRGNVWNDANGLTDLQINKTGTQAIPNALFIYLVDINTNQIVQLESILPDGTYSFLDVEINTSYKIVLSTILAFPGQQSPTPFLPSGWQRVGENLGAGPLSGSDGVPNGLLFLDTETSDIYDANFGIRVSGGEVIVG